MLLPYSGIFESSLVSSSSKHFICIYIRRFWQDILFLEDAKLLFSEETILAIVSAVLAAQQAMQPLGTASQAVTLEGRRPPGSNSFAGLNPRSLPTQGPRGSLSGFGDIPCTQGVPPATCRSGTPRLPSVASWGLGLMPHPIAAVPTASVAPVVSVAVPPRPPSVFGKDFPPPNQFDGTGSVKKWLQKLDTWMVLKGIDPSQRAAYGAYCLAGNANKFFSVGKRSVLLSLPGRGTPFAAS